MWSPPCLSAGDGGGGEALFVRLRKRPEQEGPKAYGGTKFAQADGILGSVFAPGPTRTDHMEKQRRGGRRAAETRYQLPTRTDSEGKFALRGGTWVTQTARRAIGEPGGEWS